MGEEISDSIHSNPSSYLMQRLRSSFGVSATEFQDVLEVISKKKEGLAEEIQNHETEIEKHQVEISKEQEVINRHNAAVNMHRASLVALKNKQKSLEKCLQLGQSLSSPIRRLPAETLREIFIHFCDRILLSSDGISCPALTLAAICSGWRRVALSTSQLWARLGIELIPDCHVLPLARVRQFEPLVNLALENSRNAPLHLDLTMVGVSTDLAENDAMISIIISTARHCHHWYHAQLALPDSLLYEMNPFVHDLPLLESLTIFELGEDPIPFNMTTIAPKLCHLTLSCNITPDLIARLPRDQILTLELMAVSTNEVLTSVQSCTALQRLEIMDFDGDEDQAIRDEAHIIHDHIQSLSFSRLFGVSHVEQVFTLFTFPRMTQISLTSESYGHGRGWTWTAAFTRISKLFFTRSSSAIVSLKLKWIPIPDETLIALLRLLPSIENLSVVQLTSFEKEGSKKRVCNITYLLITSLHISHSCSVTKVYLHPLLPKLQDIELAIYLDHAPSRDALVELVESRWLPDSVYASEVGVDCLKSVAFHFLGATPDVDRYDFHSLVCLRDAGMNFVATYTEDDEPADM